MKLKINLTFQKSVFLCLLITLLIQHNESLAYKSPIKFGKPDIEDLKMTVYEPDSSAEAVILCNYGSFRASSFQFVQTIRIKILKKSGTHWANRRFSSMGTTASVKGKTFNFENGEIVESKLKNESIFKERIYDDYYSIKVAMPNVKVGSVIDIQVLSSGIPQQWKFQELIPIRWSELRIESSTYFEYQKNFFGYIPFYESSPTHWITNNVPAFKMEPYMDSYKNYISKIEFDLERITFPGYYKEFATTWEKVGKILLENDYFGGVLRVGGGFLKEIEEEINQTCNSDHEKAKAAYEKIKQIKWNDIKDNTSSKVSLNTVFKEKIGNSADLNLMLVKLLNRMDIKAYPVILSSRDNGQLSQIFPSMNKLNYTVCCVELDDIKILLDPTEQKMPFGLLPERVLNNKGRLIYSKEKTEWISLNTDKKDYEKVYHHVKLNPDHSISGKRMASYKEYGAYNKRKEFDSFNSDDDYLANYESKYPGLTITDFEIGNKEDIYQKLGETWSIEIKKHVEVIDDLLMVNLNFFEQHKKNQFKLDKRIYPVSFPYCQNKSNTVVFELPEGYEVSELPAPIRLILPDNGGEFVLRYTSQNNTVVMNCKLCIDKKLFLPQEYLYLKEFFTQVVKKQAEPVILKKV